MQILFKTFKTFYLNKLSDNIVWITTKFAESRLFSNAYPFRHFKIMHSLSIVIALVYLEFIRWLNYWRHSSKSMLTAI